MKSVCFFAWFVFFYHVYIRFVRLHAFNKLFLAGNALIKLISKKIENTLESILLAYRESHLTFKYIHDVNFGKICFKNLNLFFSSINLFILHHPHVSTIQRSTVADYLFKFLIIGSAGSGKSCLLHHFIENKCKY